MPCLAQFLGAIRAGEGEAAPGLVPHVVASAKETGKYSCCPLHRSSCALSLVVKCKRG